MNHVYHYYAFRQTSFERTDMDGVLLLEHRIDGLPGFRLAKQLVAEFNKVPVEGLVLASLTYLGKSAAASAQETPVVPPGHFWRGEPESNRDHCQNCGRSYFAHTITDEATLCPTANRRNEHE